jgi:hypothetical protein
MHMYIWVDGRYGIRSYIYIWRDLWVDGWHGTASYMHMYMYIWVDVIMDGLELKVIARHPMQWPRQMHVLYYFLAS